MQSEVLRGLVVGYPHALPQRTWVLNRLIWADQIGAIWPTSTPNAATDGEQVVLQDLERLRQAGLFTECTIPLGQDDEVQTQIESALNLTRQERESFSQRFRESVNAARESRTNGGRLDRNLRFYVNKMPPETTNLLLRSRVATKTADGFLRIKSAAQAEHLMAAAAEFARPVDERGLRIMLDGATDEALATAAAPLNGAAVRPSAAVNARMIGVSTPEISDVEALIDFRLNDKNDRRRRDYLHEVDRYVRRCTKRGTPGDADGLALDRIGQDLLKAQTAYRLSLSRVAAVATQIVAAVIPLADSPGDLSTAVAAGANVGAITVNVGADVRWGRPHAYLRTARTARALPVLDA